MMWCGCRVCHVPVCADLAGSLQWRDLSDITYSLGTRQMLGAWVNNFTAEHCPGKAASMATGKATGGDAAAPKQVQSRMLLTVPTQGSTDACLGCDNADQAGEEAGDGYQQGVGGSEFRTTTGRQGPIDWPGTAGRQLAQATQPRVRGSRSAIKADVLSRLAALLEQSCQGVLIVPHGLGAGAAGEDLYLAAMAGRRRVPLQYYTSLGANILDSLAMQCASSTASRTDGGRWCHARSRPINDVVINIIPKHVHLLARVQVQCSVHLRLAGAGVSGPAQPLSMGASQSFCRLVTRNSKMGPPILWTFPYHHTSMS
jgi:hypothetical protein